MDSTAQLEETQLHGKTIKVIDDAQLLEWAAREGITPRAAQVMALRREIVPARYLKNFEALSFGEQILLCEGSALICGCGGLGGTIIQLLARAGIGRLRLVDPDAFAASNLNRQWMSDTTALGRSKAQTAAERVRLINPFVVVEPQPVRLDENNAFELLAGMQIAVDALDNLSTRFALEAGAHRRSIPFLHGAVAGWWGQASTFMPQSAFSLETIYGARRQRDPAEEATGIPGPTAAVIGSLQAMEAVRILAGKEPAYADRLLFFDGETGATSLLPF